MTARVSKKQMILDCCEQSRVARAGLPDLRLIQKQVGERAGPGPAPSLSYIASVLRSAGTPVDYEDRYTDPEIPASYAARLQGALRFNDLASGEAALRALDAAYRDYCSIADFKGRKLVQTIVLRGKQRAESLAANPRVSEQKRREKREIATWFRVWLESPSLFFEWLAVRQQTEEFRRLFASCSSLRAGDTRAEVRRR